MEEETEGNAEEGSGSGINLEVVRSYLAFARRAIRARKLLMMSVLLTGLVLTGLLARYIPRTYTCTTVLMTVANVVLDGDRGPNSLGGAEGLIMRHENLESIIKQTGLRKKFEQRRPPLLKLKDRVVASLVGEMDERTLTSVLVGTLETKLTVTVEKDTLEITVDWSDPKTAAELAEATKAGFLQIRHRAEISAFQEKMAILDSHASQLRVEIDDLALQVNASLAAKAAEMSKAGAGTAVRGTSPAAMYPRRRSAAPTDEQLPQLREKLASLKQKLTNIESDRTGRMNTERVKLDELKLRFTPNHPQVITQEDRLAIASQVPSELALLRSEVSDLDAQIKQHEAMARSGQAGAGRVASPTPAAAAAAEALPSDILQLLDRDDADPAIVAQMSGAVMRYGSLRDQVRGAKLALDTEQAAFNHRYQVVIPVEEPNKHSKPKLGLVAGAGIFLSLLLGLLLPVLLELRRGVLVERWQVDHFKLPVLAELRLPERTDP